MSSGTIITAMHITNCTCDGTPESIKLINFILIIVSLPALAISGIAFNFISFIVFRKQCSTFKSSPCVYLIALAISDCGVCMSGVLVMCADSYRAYFPSINDFLSPLIPKLVPIAVIFQMFSVYITVLAALDCYFSVSAYRIKNWWCHEKFARVLVFGTMVAVFAYNFISFFELQYSECYDMMEKRVRYQICPTSFRTDVYVEVYKGYMYLVTMALLPCILLIGLCIGIFRNMQRRTWSDVFQQDATNRLLLQNTLVRAYSVQGLLQRAKIRDQNSGSSPLMLVVVIVLFLLCNSVSLIVNCLEILTGDKFAELNLMLIDVGNVLVVFNAWANFFVYIALSHSYRSNLQSIFCNCTKISSSPTISKAECINAL